MPIMIRPATEREIAALGALRAETWGSAEYWQERIGLYLSGEHSPQQALAPRAAFIAVEDSAVIGFIAGHRTRRFGFDGELEWINVSKARRGQGIANELLVAMVAWFVEQDALRVCVNVAPDNPVARRFYARHGAVPLHKHWMAWEDVGVVNRAGENSGKDDFSR
jgi:GNAT superfamily N-acetyltransferase